VGIVCIAEPPYAEGPGDRAEPTASDEDRAVFARMRERSDALILVVYSGRPLIIPDLIEQADAVVAAWLPGTEGAALGELLAGSHPFEGTTPQPWPASAAALDERQTTPLFPVGAGTGFSPTSGQRAKRVQ
jgi:beta-glucosidase